MTPAAHAHKLKQALIAILRIIETVPPAHMGPRNQAIFNELEKINDKDPRLALNPPRGLGLPADGPEQTREKIARYERGLNAIKNCPLVGPDFEAYAHSTVGDLLEDFEAECWNCETAVHDGPCVDEAWAAEEPDPEGETHAAHA